MICTPAFRAKSHTKKKKSKEGELKKEGHSSEKPATQASTNLHLHKFRPKQNVRHKKKPREKKEFDDEREGERPHRKWIA